MGSRAFSRWVVTARGRRPGSSRASRPRRGTRPTTRFRNRWGQLTRAAPSSTSISRPRVRTEGGAPRLSPWPGAQEHASGRLMMPGSGRPPNEPRDDRIPWGRAVSRRQFLAGASAGGAMLVLSGVPGVAAATRRASAVSPRDSVVLLWNEAFLQGVRESKLGPPMVARALAIVHTCMYDAWAAYDRQAIGTSSSGSLRRPARERTLANRVQAISFAA